MIPERKICTVCLVEKDKSCFQTRKKPNGYMWLRAECILCQNEKRRSVYYPKNKNKILLRNKKYILERKEYKKEYDRKREIKIKDKRRKQKLAEYYTKRNTDIDFRIKRSLRARIYFAITKGEKCAKTQDLIGCSIAELKKHLESLFDNKMNWDNYGINGWHIDHKLPCSSFDLSSEDEQRKCFNYTNLQPLWWWENIEKGCRIL